MTDVSFDFLRENSRHLSERSTFSTASEKQRRNFALKTKSMCCGVAWVVNPEPKKFRW
jgi:hypothetical protein